MIRTLAALLLLTSAAAAAEEYITPAPVSPEAKILALKLGYILNGNSMVRWGSIDLPAEMAKARTAPDPTTIPDTPAKPRGRR